MKIALLGLFGCGNTGNDGSLESMVSFLRQSTPEAELLCICPNPEIVSADLGIAAVRHGRVQMIGHWSAVVNRRLADIPRNVLSALHLFKTMRGVRTLIIPGTGILDDFQETAFGWPFVVFRWCLAARLSGVPIAFVSIGAGPIKHPVSRWFLKSAVRMARYRSYRDDFSRDYLRDIGVDVSLDGRYPDLAFRLPQPFPGSARQPGLNIGVGVMSYHGWSKNNADSGGIYESYLSKLAAYICWLTDQGHNVRLLTGDIHDFPAIDDILEKLSASLSTSILGGITVARGGSLHELMAEIEKTDMVVASRYHNVVCALKMNRPVISLSYNMKNDYLLAQFGQHHCQHIESFDIEALKQQTNTVLSEIDGIARQSARSNVMVQKQLLEQEGLLLDHIAGACPPTAVTSERDVGPSKAGQDSSTSSASGRNSAVPDCLSEGQSRCEIQGVER
jgi:polysaccharide pyruvyl transferase WcaK-like protein